MIWLISSTLSHFIPLVILLLALQSCLIFLRSFYKVRLLVDAKGTCPSDFCLARNPAFSLEKQPFTLSNAILCNSARMIYFKMLASRATSCISEHVISGYTLLFLLPETWVAGMLTSPVESTAMGYELWRARAITAEEPLACLILHPCLTLPCQLDL